MTTARYNPQFFDELANAEDRHFWFVHRNRVIGDLLRASGVQAPRRILEVGCGTGNVLRVLTAACPGAQVVGLEVFAEGLALARSRTTAALVRGRVEAMPFTSPFDVIGMFDVLEHIPDDRGALTAIRQQLGPGGRVLLTVPAHAWLWSEFDVASGHVRRYSVASLEHVCRQSGLRIAHMTQFMAPLVPLAWVSRRLRRRHGTDAVSSELNISRVANAMLLSVLGLERRLLARGWRLPTGTSIGAVAVAA